MSEATIISNTVTEQENEQDEREQAEMERKEQAATLLVDITAEIQRLESREGKSWVKLGGWCQEYLLTATNPFTDPTERANAHALAVKELAACIRAATDRDMEPTRLVKVFWLAELATNEIDKVSPSILKVLCPLVQSEGIESPDLLYQLVAEMEDQGLVLCQECVEGKHTVASAAKRMAEIRIAAFQGQEQNGATAKGKGAPSGPKPASASQKITKSIKKALKDADPKAKAKAFRTMAETGDLPVSAIVAAIEGIGNAESDDEHKRKALSQILVALKAQLEKLQASATKESAAA